MAERSIQDRYFELLRAYVDSPEEKFLAAAAQLGRELVLADVPPEDIAEIHEHALHRLGQESPDLTLLAAAQPVSTPLMELLMAYGLAFRERLEIRRRAEEAIRESERKLRSVIEQSGDGIMLADEQGAILEWNGAMEQITGLKQAEVLGRPWWEIRFQLIPDGQRNPAVYEQIKAHALEYLETGQAPWLGQLRENRFRRSDGTHRLVQSAMFSIRTDKGFMVGNITRDLTKRRQLEEQVRRQERLAAVGEWASGIAHDFNNVLTSIILYVQMLLRQPHLPPDLVEGLENIINDARGAIRLVQRILDFSHQSLMEARQVDLVSFIQENVGVLLRRTLPDTISLTIEVETDECVVNADPARIQQALMNLASNARDAMPEGGELRIGLSRVEVRPREYPRAEGVPSGDEEPPVAEMPPGEWACLSISDTGAGIPLEVMPRLFEPFFTTKPTRHGMGLAQVYGIVKQHRGYIGVDPGVGQGMTFRVSLPVRRAEEADKQHPIEEVLVEEEALALLRGEGEIILLAEDEDRVRELGREVLESLGYRVLTAANGREALEVYRSAERVDLVIADMVMPEMGGKELMEELRKLDPHMKGLIITGYALKEDLRQLKEEGILEVVYKPFDIDTLAQMVRRALDVD